MSGAMKALLYRSSFLAAAALVYRLLLAAGLGYWLPARWSHAVSFVGMVAFSIALCAALFLAARPAVALLLPSRSRR